MTQFFYNSAMEKKYYYAFTDYCKQNFGRKLYRVALDAHMTCPNRDGKIDTRGCIFCDAGGSGDFAISYEGQKLTKQDLIYNHQDAEIGDYIAYFQAYTNTYATYERLKQLFTAALSDTLFAGISVATRPDCVNEETIRLFQELKQAFPNKFIWVELGLQTMHERSAVFIRRGYRLEVFDACVEKLHAIGVSVIAHVIIGLPNETEQDVLDTIHHLNVLQIDGVKLQLLHYLKGCDLGKMYLENPNAFHVLRQEEYIHIVVNCIGNLDKQIVIHRLTGDGAGELLLAPLWSKDKRRVLNMLRHALKEKNIVQGCLL